MTGGLRPAALPILVVVLLVALHASYGCAWLPANDDDASDRLCTPGSYVFCRCPDRSEGTKLCRSDGQSFEACTSGAGACGSAADPGAGTLPDAASDLPTPLRAAVDPAEGCAGAATPLPAAATIRLTGDTTTATEDRHGSAAACAAGAGAGDHVYRVLPAASGALSVTAEATGALHPVVYLRTDCHDPASEVACGATGADADDARATLTAMVRAGEPYFVVVDGQDGTRGGYTVTLALTEASFCGDARVDPAEACDDGNATDGDGCSADCRRVDGNPASAGGCPGQAVDVWPGVAVTGDGTTAGYGSVWEVPPDRCGAFAADHIYAVIPHATGALTVRVEPRGGPDPTLLVGAACAPPAGAISCGSAATVDVPVSAGRPIWVAVRGDGDFAIAFAVVADGGL